MTVAIRNDGPVAVIEMTGDGRHNPLSAQLVADMLAALHDRAVRSARAIVIAGAAKSFCAGANIPDLLDGGWMDETPRGRTPEDLFRKIDKQDRPTFAAVHGNVMGGGFELALCTDLLVADPDTRFALPETGLGVIPNTALPRLAAMVGVRRALDIVLTRRTLSADEAHKLGLVTAISGEEGPVAAAVAQARAIVETAPPGALAAVKRELRWIGGTDWAQVHRTLAALPRAEWTEGLTAFTERRAPDFQRFWEDP